MKYFFFAVAVFATVACSNKTDSSTKADSTAIPVVNTRNENVHIRRAYGMHDISISADTVVISFQHSRYSEKGTNQAGIAGAAALMAYNDYAQAEKEKFKFYRAVFVNGVNSKSQTLTRAELETLNGFQIKARETANLLCTGNYKALKERSIPQNTMPADSIKLIFGDLFTSNKPLDSIEFFTVFAREAKLPDASIIQSVRLKGNFYLDGKTYKYSVGYNMETGRIIGVNCNLKKADKDLQLPLN